MKKFNSLMWIGIIFTSVVILSIIFIISGSLSNSKIPLKEKTIVDTISVRKYIYDTIKIEKKTESKRRTQDTLKTKKDSSSIQKNSKEQIDSIKVE